MTHVDAAAGARRPRRFARAERTFVGPWEAFEVLYDEFRRIDSGLKVDCSDIWRFRAADIIDARRVLDRLLHVDVRGRWPTPPGRIRRLLQAFARRLRDPIRREKLADQPDHEEHSLYGAPPEIPAFTGGSDEAITQSVADALNRMLLLPPATLVDICWAYLLGERGRALRRNPPDRASVSDTPHQWENVRERFNRQVLEVSLRELVHTAADRGLERLFREARRREEPEGRSRFALCLSGGGIRSASFSLGVLQGLAAHDKLSRFDYISTVSGGGYIGSWLSSWMSRVGRTAVEQALKPKSGQAKPPLVPEPAPVRHLRSYSNYLSPRKGLMSADMWTLFSTFLRNLLLNWVVVLPAIAAVLMVPIIGGAVASNAPSTSLRWIIGVLIGLGAIAATMGVYYVHTRRPAADELKLAECHPTSPEAELTPDIPRGRSERAFLALCLAPITIAAMSLSLAWKWSETLPADDRSLIPLWAIPVILGAAIHIGGWILAMRRLRMSILAGWAEALAVVVTGGLVGAIVYWGSKGIDAASVALDIRLGARTLLPQEIARPKLTLYAMIAFPSYIIALVIGGFAFVGITSEKRRDEDREWSSRYSAWLLIVALTWLVGSALVLFSASILNWLGAVAAGALVSGRIAAVLGRSEQTPDPHEPSSAASSGIRGILLAHTLTVISLIALLLTLMTVAALDIELVRWLIGGPDEAVVVYWVPGPIILTAVVLALLSGFFAAAVDVNKFSLHGMYRERLIRAYLGASRSPGARYPNPFTGFDPADNMHMRCLDDEARPRKEQPPIHVVNIALNLTAANKLEWQDRKARSFTVTPYHAGAVGLGYRSTRFVGGRADTAYGGRHGITLGTAMAISGAAASPNMGYHSSPAITFLMTVFNARLGWWLGNPGWAGRPTFNQSVPRQPWPLIFSELLSLTGDSSPYVYLSDGGHFENLGLYEMVLRRCRRIVVVDASGDGKCALDDLANAIRRINIDFGVSVKFADAFDIVARNDSAIPLTDRKHFAIGRIGYDDVDPAEPPGTLVYIKPTLTKGIPRDVSSYSLASLEFPHESTADQFFSEMQLESYRALGEYSVDELFARWPQPERDAFFRA
jgi:hypothetical protein